MQIVTTVPSKTDAGCVCTLGVFDGVHRGHRFLLDGVRAEAAARGLLSAAVTFRPHPAVVLGHAMPPLLTTDSEKELLMAETGIDMLVALPFTKETAGMTVTAFLQWLKSYCNVKVLVMGYDHRFGCEQRMDAAYYAACGAACGVEVRVMPQAPLPVDVSSTAIRACLTEGDVAGAAERLGRPYSIEGVVVDGHRMGRRLGFPTANLHVPDGKLLPRGGVYAVRVYVGATCYKGMMNIGTCPTFESGCLRRPEVHIIDFDQTIYHERIRVELIGRMRDERRFDSAEQLVAQLRLDAEQAKGLIL